MKNLIIFLFAYVVSLQSFAGSSINRNEDKDVFDMLYIRNYEWIYMHGFNEFKDRTATTYLIKKDLVTKEEYEAIIRANSDGQFLYFYTTESCTTEQNKPFPTIINVNGKNIQAEHTCSRKSNGVPFKIYQILTAAGNDFVIEQFKTLPVVYIQFHSMKIPFDSVNFNNAWDNAGGAAL